MPLREATAQPQDGVNDAPWRRRVAAFPSRRGPGPGQGQRPTGRGGIVFSVTPMLPPIVRDASGGELLLQVDDEMPRELGLASSLTCKWSLVQVNRLRPREARRECTCVTFKRHATKLHSMVS